MIVEVKIPSPGESITQVQIAGWLVKNGDYIEKDQEIVEIDSDKATLAIPATDAGIISIVAQEGDTLPVGAVICTIDTAAARPEKPAAITPEEKKVEPAEKPQPGKITTTLETSPASVKFTPLARKVLEEKGMGETEALDLLKKSRLTRKDVESIMEIRFFDGENLPAMSREIER